VHQQLGVDPDLGHGHVTVVPQIPGGQQKVAGSNIRLGRGSVDVAASLVNKELRTEVAVNGVSAAFTIGAVLPAGAKAGKVTLDGHDAQYKLVQTSRGTEVQVLTEQRTSILKVTLR
jgi:hypothetical protein